MPTWPIAIFLILAVACSAMAIRLWRSSQAQRGWFVVLAAVMGPASAGVLLGLPGLVLGAFSIWLLLVWSPSVLALVARSLAQREWYDAAAWFARAASILHPCDGWLELPRYLAAFGRARAGDIDDALRRLDPLSRSGSPLAQSARMHMWRLAQCWEEIVAWADANPGRVTADGDTFALVLRALGETGDTAAMVDLFERRRGSWGEAQDALVRDAQRLALFAFGGRPDGVRRVLARSFPAIPPMSRDFWLATARLNAGQREAARSEFERLLSGAREPWPRVLRRRIESIDAPRGPLDERREGVIDAEAAECEADTRYNARGAFLSAEARGTHLLLVANLVAFVVEVGQGGSTDLPTLDRLGGLDTGKVMAGEWWRLVAATFLHLGPLHLAMNLLALAALGPPAERQLGHARFLAVYLLSGVGAMAVCTARALVTGQDVFVVGASGSVMGLVGATAAIMLRGWMRDRAVAARNRGAVMAGYVVLQMAVDSMVPVFSFTTHLAGAVIGFLAALLGGDRLDPRVPSDPPEGA